ncbi:MAG: P27 family phage terminase small subunit [Acidobacteriia bacterium]|nr:P27 family phage terminase small subunit [Terriglobia bacterium]
MKNAVKPPKNQSKKARILWRELQAEYQIEDAAGLDLLADYCQFFDRREQARVLIRQNGPTVLDRFQQIQVNPACRVERDSSAAMIKILRQLNLDVEPTRDRPGRPPGTGR